LLEFFHSRLCLGVKITADGDSWIGSSTQGTLQTSNGDACSA
jgi:hypothetical protein